MFEIVPDTYRKYPNEVINLPRRATYQSAGYDFYSPVEIIIDPHCSSPLIFTDVCIKFESDFNFLTLVPRSSLGIKKGIRLSNTVGIIDYDYYYNPETGGNIGFKLYNDSNETVTIKKGERIMQGIILSYEKFIGEVEPTEKRTGGFGSTNDKKL